LWLGRSGIGWWIQWASGDCATGGAYCGGPAGREHGEDDCGENPDLLVLLRLLLYRSTSNESRGGVVSGDVARWPALTCSTCCAQATEERREEMSGRAAVAVLSTVEEEVRGPGGEDLEREEEEDEAGCDWEAIGSVCEWST
jgi:hypothetical protein